MDLDVDLVQFQGGLMKANNSVPFKSLSSRGGNENDIKRVVDTIHQILSDKGLIGERITKKESVTTLRRIDVFLILNSDLSALDDFTDNNDIGHLVWIAPKIPPCLLIHLVWGLNLDRFFCEVITYCHPKLSLELLQIAIQNLKYCNAEKSIVKAKDIVIAAYSSLNSASGGAKSPAVTLFENICELLKYFTDPPNKSKMAKWTARKLYHFSGQTIHCLLETLIKCFSMYCDGSKLEKLDFAPYEYLCCKDLHQSEENVLDEHLKKVNDLLVECAKTNIMAINIDVYCSWCEYDLNVGSNRTLQTAIGELAYELIEILEKNESLNNDLVSLLQQIARKPEELSEKINAADPSAILQGAYETGDDQHAWLMAMFQRDYFFENEEFIECLTLNCDVLQHSNLITILKSSMDILLAPHKNDNFEKIKILSIECWRRLDNEEKRTFLLDNFSERHFSNILESPNFQQNMTEIMNKIIDVNDNTISQLNLLFIQNPLKFYTYIFNECSKSMKLFKVIKALTHFKDFYSIKYTCEEISLTANDDIQNMIIHVLNKIQTDHLSSDSEKQTYINFIRELLQNGIIEESSILLRHVIPALDENLKNKNLRNLTLFLNCLRVSFYPSNSPQLICPILVMCGQILEVARWDLNTFTVDAVDVVQEAINVQQMTFPYFMLSKRPTDKEWMWLVSKISLLTPLNAIYFKGLSQDFDVKIFDTSSNDQNLKICLAYTLTRSTLEEWKTVFSDLSKSHGITASFSLFCDIVIIICNSAKNVNTKNAYFCLEHCYKNTSSVLQDICSEDIAEYNTLLKNVICILNCLPISMKESTFNLFLNSLSNLVTRWKTHSGEHRTENQELMNTIITLNYEPIKDILFKMVSNIQDT